jgi:hypothetical protein
MLRKKVENEVLLKTMPRFKKKSEKSDSPHTLPSPPCASMAIAAHSKASMHGWKRPAARSAASHGKGRAGRVYCEKKN